MDTENRIERAFHDQTRYFDTKFERMLTHSDQKIDSTIRWGIGLIITMILALVLAIFIQPYVGPQ